MMLVLGNYADKFGFAWPGVKTVAGDTKQSERNIQYLIGKAVACGELEVFLNCGPVMPKARQRTNLFRLTFCEPPPPEHPYFGIKEWCKDCTTSNGSGGASQREKGGARIAARWCKPASKCGAKRLHPIHLERLFNNQRTERERATSCARPLALLPMVIEN